MPDIKTINNIKQHVLRKIPDEVITTAQEMDVDLYAVGGCVRDSIINKQLKDIDLSVVGDAIELAKKASKKLGSGKVSVYSRFGTAMIRTSLGEIEFATSRSESYADDSRKPVSVQAVPIEEDLHRRDFTINALALGLTGHATGVILDLFEGQADLANGIIRTPLEPDATFSDDPLRMFRAIRFAAELGFEIEQCTWDGIRNNIPRVKILAAERIRDEFLRMLEGSDPVRAMQLLIDSGLMEEFLPEVILMKGVEQVGRHHHKDVLIHSLKVMQNVVANSEDPIIRLAALLHDVGKPRTKKFFPEQGWTFHGHEVVGARMAAQICRRLRLGKDKTARLTNLISLHMRPVNLTSEGVTDSAIRRLMVESGDDLDAQLVLCRADITTANPKLVKLYLNNFEEMQQRMGDVSARDKMRRFNSPVRGDEIIQICDIQPGPMIGALKERIEDAILDGIIPYEYEAAKEYLLKIKDEVMKSKPDEIQEERRNRSKKRRQVKSDYSFPSDD